MTVIKLNGKVWDIRLSVNFQIRRHHHRNVENVTHIILIPETTLPLLTQTSSLMHLRSANHHPRNASKKVIISYLFYPITIMLSILTAFTTTTLLLLLGVMMIILAIKNCWFCLDNDQVEDHLVISIGDESYLALPKGGLVPDHLLIISLDHLTSPPLPPPLQDEILRFSHSTYVS